jgi:hypothetical protein
VVDVHEDIAANHSIKVGFHQLEDDVDVAIIRRAMHGQDFRSV